MTEIELQAGYLYEYMRAHLTHVKLVEYNPDRLQRVKQQGLDKIIQTLEQYADGVSQESRKEILFELISIKQYMEERDAFHGYGQMNDLITKLQLTESKQEQS